MLEAINITAIWFVKSSDMPVATGSTNRYKLLMINEIYWEAYP